MHRSWDSHTFLTNGIAMWKFKDRSSLKIQMSGSLQQLSVHPSANLGRGCKYHILL